MFRSSENLRAERCAGKTIAPLYHELGWGHSGNETETAPPALGLGHRGESTNRIAKRRRIIPRAIGGRSAATRPALWGKGLLGHGSRYGECRSGFGRRKHPPYPSRSRGFKGPVLSEGGGEFPLPYGHRRMGSAGLVIAGPAHPSGILCYSSAPDPFPAGPFCLYYRHRSILNCQRRAHRT